VSDEDHVRKREEFRALMTLSLLALLLLIRTNLDKLSPQQEIDLHIPFIQGYINVYPAMVNSIDIVSFFWMIYAILTILRFSDDLIGSEKIRRGLGQFALACLVVGPLLVTSLFLFVLEVVYVAYFYPASIFFLVVFAVIFAVVYLVLRKYRLKLTIEPRQEQPQSHEQSSQEYQI
jgi:hypothetical protein